MSARVLRDKHAIQFDKLIAFIERCLVEEASCFADGQSRLLAEFDRLAVNIQAVRQKEEIIAEVRSADFWQNPTIQRLETARTELRNIMKYRRQTTGPSYETATTATKDSGLELHEREVEIAGANDAMLYRRRLKDILDTMIDASPTLQKIRQGEAIEEAELKSLTSTILANHPGVSLDVLNTFYGRTADQLHLTICEIIGLDPEAIEAHFKGFLHAHPALTAKQVQFMNLLKNYIAQYGSIVVDKLYEAPFTSVSDEGIEGVFSLDEADDLIATLKPFLRPGAATGTATSPAQK